MRLSTRLLWVPLLILFSAGAASATTVTGTVTDAGGHVYANGTVLATFVPTPGGQTPLCSGGAITTPVSGTLNGSGAFSITLCANTLITPVGSTWSFRVCSFSNSVCFNLTGVTISGTTQSLTSQLSAAAPAIPGIQSEPPMFALGTVAIQVYAAAGQTANLISIKDYTGTSLFAVDASGNVTCAGTGCGTGGGTADAQTCTNQVLAAVSSPAVGGNCVTITANYVNNSIAQTGADINTSNQVTSLHLSAPTTNAILKETSTGNATPSLLSDNATTLSYTGTGGISTPKTVVTGSGGGAFDFTEGTAQTAASSHDVCYADSTAHMMLCNYNNDGSGAFYWLPNFHTDHGTSRTMAAKAEIYVCTSTCTFTPPTPVEGLQFCVQNDDNISTVITLAAVSSVQYEATARTSYGTANHTMTSGGAVKDQICMVGRDATHWNVWSSVGTWTNN